MNRTQAALALAAFAGLILVAAPPRAAHAGIGSSCEITARTATFALDLAGTSLRVSAGYGDSGSWKTLFPRSWTCRSTEAAAPTCAAATGVATP